MAVVEKVPIEMLIFLFVIYICIHIYLLYSKEQAQKKFDKIIKGDDLGEAFIVEKELKDFKLYARWFPFVYVIVCVLLLIMVR